jgi:soluble lytic murein transglycosylase-like protein
MSEINKVGPLTGVPPTTGAKRRNDNLAGRAETPFSSVVEKEAALPVQAQQQATERDEQPPEGFLNEAAKQRTMAELRTLVRAIQAGLTDPFQLTDIVFYARHPDLVGKPLEDPKLLDEWNTISALMVHPVLNEVANLLGTDNVAAETAKEPQQVESRFARAAASPVNRAKFAGVEGTRRWDDVIVDAVQWCPGLSPAILKGLLAQESNFNPSVINKYGYAGIAQFGRPAAREVGLNVGVAGSASDERLDPNKAIPGAARLLNIKAQRLGEIAFSRYGQPQGVEFWKFVLAAYNGGEGTVALAMGHAYREGLAQARNQGLVGTEAVSYARQYASRWDNLSAGGTGSPLGQAAARYFPSLAESKYHEIRNYPVQIVARSVGARV